MMDEIEKGEERGIVIDMESKRKSSRTPLSPFFLTHSPLTDHHVSRSVISSCARKREFRVLQSAPSLFPRLALDALTFTAILSLPHSSLFRSRFCSRCMSPVISAPSSTPFFLPVDRQLEVGSLSFFPGTRTSSLSFRTVDHEVGTS